MDNCRQNLVANGTYIILSGRLDHKINQIHSSGIPDSMEFPVSRFWSVISPRRVVLPAPLSPTTKMSFVPARLVDQIKFSFLYESQGVWFAELLLTIS